MSFKVIQGQRCMYQSKDSMQLKNGHPISYRFEVIADCFWTLCVLEPSLGA